MNKFIVEDDFFELFPNAKIGVITFYSIDNTIKNTEYYRELLDESQKEAMKFLENEEFSKNEVIKVWRDAFQKFKTKKGTRASIESLYKRISKGNEISNINPLVDIYNSISIKYALPCGGEDIEAFEGNVRLTKANGNEDFVTLGSEKNEPPYEGEVVYKDDFGAICRCLNWRECSRTMLKESTKNAFLCIETIDDNRQDDFEDAINELSRLVNENLGGTFKIQVVDINNKQIEF